MSELSNRVRLLVESEVRRGNEHIEAWSTRLGAHALALRRGQLAQKEYGAEVSKWREQVRGEVCSLHLKGAAAACGGQLPQEVLERVTARLSEPLTLVDELARLWLERPPTTEKPFMVVRGGASAERAASGALETFDWLQRLWEEEKHPRDENGRFAHGAGLQSHMSDGSDDVVAKIVSQGPLDFIGHSRAPLARKKILDIDIFHQSQINLLHDRIEEIEAKKQEFKDRIDSKRKINPYLIPASGYLEYRRLDAKISRLNTQIKAIHRKRRREIWSQLSVQNPTNFKVVSIESVSKERQKHIESSISLIEQLIDTSIVKNTNISFIGTDEERSEYKNGEVFLRKWFDSPEVAHEIGHHLEMNHPLLLQALVGYRDARVAEAKEMGKIRKNAEPEQIPNLDKGEIAYLGVFHDDYIAKIYDNNKATEILTMGLEYYVRNPVKFAEVDADMFDFIYNVLRGDFQLRR